MVSTRLKLPLDSVQEEVSAAVVLLLILHCPR